MELVGPIIEVLKCFWGPTRRYVDYHRKLDKNVNELRTGMERLNGLKEVLELKKAEANRHGKEVNPGVDPWFEDVERIYYEMQEIEKEFPTVSYFSRACLGKRVYRKIQEVESLCQRGSFPEGVAVDGPPDIRVTLATENLVGEIDVMNQIWEYLMGDEVGMIGVCGMGGIGKTTILTHINDRLLKKRDRFGIVRWVDVPEKSNVFKLQDVIAEFLKVKESLPTDGRGERAALLKKNLEKTRYVFILDNVWEPISLDEVGIPEPSRERKVVLTTRSTWVCDFMGCKVVEVQPLSKEESMDLFLNHLGRSVERDENLVSRIVAHCGGLPLAIKVIAGSLVGSDICEWWNTLHELQESMKSIKGSDTEIFKPLRVSFDLLRNSMTQNCFLYCSLYPKSSKIERVKLIESWIDEGLLDDFENREALHYRGHTILNILEKNFLLEKASSDTVEKVKMHDVLRDMALDINRDSHKFLVKAGMNMKELPKESEWTVNLEKVSLMYNSISEIPPHISTRCLHLSTLLLQGNNDLRCIPEDFFQHIPKLKVLNLSDTRIMHLPKSISKLTSLSALILASCKQLRSVPSLAELKALKKLDLYWTDIKEVPHGIEMLEKLTYLSVWSKKLKELPAGILPMISHLQCLLIKGVYLWGAEVGKLRKLEILSCWFCDMQEFEKYEKCIQGKWPTNFHFQVGSSAVDLLKESMVVQNLKELHKKVTVVDYKMEEIDNLGIRGCHDFKCLGNIPLFHKVTALNRFKIWRCEGIECVVDMSSSTCNALHNIESLELRELCHLHEFVRVGVAVESTSHAPTPPAIFSSLKELLMDGCSRMKKLFPLELLQGIQNLEKINVQSCDELEEIIASEEEEKGKNHRGKATSILPKLKSLCLTRLPKLESICGNGVTIPADSLQILIMDSCPKLKRIPLTLSLLENGQPSPPRSLKGIRAEPSEWWESVEWDQPNAKDALSYFVGLSLFLYSDDDPSPCSIM